MTLAIFFASQFTESIILVPFAFSCFFGTALFDTQGSCALSVPDWVQALILNLTLICTIACILYCTKSEKRSLDSIGFRYLGKPCSFVEYIIGYVIGACMFAIAWIICVFSGAVEISPKEITPQILPLIAFFFFGYLFQGMSEEVLCRGFMMQSMAASYPAVIAVLSNSVVFALLHLGNAGISPLAIFNLTLFGIFASIYIWKRGNIWGIAATHSAWNFVQGNVLGISVSGTRFGPAFIRTNLHEEMKLITGGTFGLEGGLAVTAVFAVGILILLFIVPVNKEIEIRSSENN